MSLSNSRENFDRAREPEETAPDRLDRKTESRPETPPESPVEKLEASFNQTSQKAEQRAAATEAVIDGRTHTLEDRIQPTDATDEIDPSKKATFEEMVRADEQLREEAQENYRILKERADQIMGEAKKTSRVDMRTGYSSMARYEKDVEAFKAATEAWDALMHVQKVNSLDFKRSFTVQALDDERIRKSQLTPAQRNRERMRERNDELRFPTDSTPVKPRPAVDTRGEYRIPKAQLNRDQEGANTSFRPPETAPTGTEKDNNVEEKIADGKKKLGMALKNFITVFGDGTIPEIFREFAESNPTPEQYDVAAAQIRKLFHGDFMKSERETSKGKDGIYYDPRAPKYKAKLREIAESLKPGGEQNKAEINPPSESPEQRHKKFKNYEAHKDSAERGIKWLQEVKNRFEKSNNIEGALNAFENGIGEIIRQRDNSLIETLRGQPIDLNKEKKLLDINDSQLDDYKRMREAQNSLSQGKSVKDAVSGLEKQFGEGYGLQQIDLGKIKTIKELRGLKIGFDASPELTDDPSLDGKIKEISGVGYHIPDVPQYNIKGETIVGTFNQDVKARPRVVVYKARESRAAGAA